jgi:hypothetical protein
MAKKITENEPKIDWMVKAVQYSDTKNVTCVLTIICKHFIIFLRKLKSKNVKKQLLKFLQTE